MGNAKQIDMANMEGFAKVIEKTERIAGIRLIITPVGDGYDLEFAIKGSAVFLRDGLLEAAHRNPELRAAIVQAAEVLRVIK